MQRLITRFRLGWSALSLSIVAAAMPAAAMAKDPAPAAPAPASVADSPSMAAKRAFAITDAVLTHHIDPPTRQQMILSGIQALYQATGLPLPPGLSRRVSSVTTLTQLNSLLVDIWPPKPAKASTVAAREQAFFDGVLRDVAGIPQLIQEKERIVMEQTEGNRYVGIHIALGMSEKAKRPQIMQVIKGGPAARAGVKADDLLVTIDGIDTKDMKIREAIDRLRGQEGTDVTITVRQNETANPRTYTITRGLHARSTVQGAKERGENSWDCRLSATDSIAYMRIGEIAASTPHDLRKLAAQLLNPAEWAIILDLRGVGGTSVHPAVLLADALLGSGVIGRMQTADREFTYQAEPDVLFPTSSIAVLVDSQTQGTAEWIAAALQDHHRATIVGLPTFSAMHANGPNTARTTDMRTRVSLGDGEWSIELTTGRLKRGDGRYLSSLPTTRGSARQTANRTPAELEKVATGVKPDLTVPLPRNVQPQPQPRMGDHQEPNIANDIILREAVRVLRKSLMRVI